MSVKPQKLPQQGHQRPHAVRSANPLDVWRAHPERPVPPAAVVLHVFRHGNHHLVTVQLKGGQIDKGMDLVTEGSHDRWSVRALGFSQPAAWAAGLRDLQLAPVGHHRILHAGERLIPVDEIG